MNQNIERGRLALADGHSIPNIGLGVFRTPAGETTEQAVLAALRAGYRHIDTARSYGNEMSVGDAVRKSGVPRESIFITTKLLNADVRAQRAREALEESLAYLQTDYIDLCLIHWPVEGRLEAWKVLEAYQRAGKVRSIGVSNFQPHHLDELLKVAEIAPVVNQFECHPYLSQVPLLGYCASHGIACEAYSPLGGPSGGILDDPVIARLAQVHGRTPAQVVLRWHLQHRRVALPKSVHAERIAENISIADFTLSDGDMAAIDALNADRRFGRDPDHIDF